MGHPSAPATIAHVIARGGCAYPLTPDLNFTSPPERWRRPGRRAPGCYGLPGTYEGSIDESPRASRGSATQPEVTNRPARRGSRLPVLHARGRMGHHAQVRWCRIVQSFWRVYVASAQISGSPPLLSSSYVQGCQYKRARNTRTRAAHSRSRGAAVRVCFAHFTSSRRRRRPPRAAARGWGTRRGSRAAARGPRRAAAASRPSSTGTPASRSWARR